jgi:hypothetical protein
VAKMAAGGAAAARRKVCAAMAQAAATTAREGWWCWLLARWRDGRLAADKVGSALVKKNLLILQKLLE